MSKTKDRKGSVVRTIKNNRTERAAAVRLDKSDMTFYARDPDVAETPDMVGKIVYFESKNGREVEIWLTQRLQKKLTIDKPLTWLPVIEVRVDQPDEYRYGRSALRNTEERETSVRAEVDRYFIALTHDKKQWLKLEWHEVDPESSTQVAEEDRIAASSRYGNGPKVEQPPTGERRYRDQVDVFALPSFNGAGKSVVAYTEELWLGLNQLFDNLDNTVKTINGMLGTKKGLSLIAEVGAGAKRLSAGPAVTDKE